MIRMFNLFTNEKMKIFRRISTWVMVICLVIITVGVGLLMRFAIPGNEKKDIDWKSSLSTQNEELKSLMEDKNLMDKVKEEYARIITVNEYRINHDIPPTKTNSLWGFVIEAKFLISLISLFIIIIGSSIVANEFSAGTIKLLLIRPVRRWKILLSKYIATFSTAVMMLAVLFGVSFVIGGILFGFKGVSHPYVGYSNGKAFEINMVIYIFGQYGLKCIDMLMMVTLAFMISTVFRNGAIAIGTGVFLLLAGSSITQLLTVFSKNGWVKYILFANTDLTQYTDGVPLIEGMTMQFSIIVLIVYFIIFNTISWTTFLKRDVAA